MGEPLEVCYRMQGHVTFDNLMAVRRAGEEALQGAGDRAAVDVSGLENGNSAAVAVLMAWLRCAESLGKSVVFVGMPARLAKIIELSGMTEVLPLTAGAAPGSGSAA